MRPRAQVTEFLCQKPWLADQGGEFTANVNKMIRNMTFQQVIIERMDRLKPGIHLTLKVTQSVGSLLWRSSTRSPTTALGAASSALTCAPVCVWRVVGCRWRR